MNLTSLSKWSNSPIKKKKNKIKTKPTSISEHQGIEPPFICCLCVSLFYIHQFTYASALLWILNVLSTVDLYYYPGFKVTVLCNDLRANLHYLEKKPKRECMF